MLDGVFKNFSHSFTIPTVSVVWTLAFGKGFDINNSSHKDLSSRMFNWSK